MHLTHNWASLGVLMFAACVCQELVPLLLAAEHACVTKQVATAELLDALGEDMQSLQVVGL